MVRRTKIAQAGMRLASNVFVQRRCQPRFADALLARDPHPPTFAAFCLLPAADEQLDFLITPDKRRLSRAQGLKAADLATLAQHAPGALSLAKPRKLLRSQILQIEQPADLPACRLGDDQRVRRGQALQPGGKVRGLTDHPALLRRALADPIADHGEPGRDAQPAAE